MTGPVGVYRIGSPSVPSLMSGAVAMALGGLIFWMSATTSVAGVATVFPTADGTASGRTLFQDIALNVATAENNTGSMVAVPVAGLKAVGVDKRTVTYNVVTGATLIALGATTVSAPDGTRITVLLVGSPA